MQYHDTPSERITAREAMRHPYFRDIKESERGTSKAPANGKQAHRFSPTLG